MANMSYCRFNNTLNVLEDCKEALENEDIGNAGEKKKAKALIQLCREIADSFDDDYVDSIITDDDYDEEEED